VGPSELDQVERRLLLHLLEHHSQQVRFEASQWVTEFGILRRFSEEDPGALRRALRSLEMARMVYRRTQYVVGYSEPKHVYTLTPSGHRKALEVLESNGGDAADPPADAEGADGPGPNGHDGSGSPEPMA
jgi:DNA-binding PadR family transcriptional regulator